MTKGEVAGLQAIAKQNGTSLTTNPHTGLPEAFSLKSLIPIAAGFALGPAGFGIASSAMGAGLMVGGATALATGSLNKGLMAGLGAYGGAGLGAGLAASGAQAGAGEVVANEAADRLAQETLMQQQATAAQNTALAETTANAQNFAGQVPTSAGVDGVVAQTPYAPPPTTQTYADVANSADMERAVAGAPQLPQSAYNATTSASSLSADQLANSNAGLSKPEILSKGFQNLSTEAGRDAAITGMGGGTQAVKYGAAAAAPLLEQKPYTAPEIKRDSDMGQRYMYDSGYDASIPGRTANPSYTKVSNEEARKYYGFAEGGSTSSALGDASSGYGAYTAQDANTAAYGLGTGIDYSGYDTAPNQGIGALTPSVNPNQNIVELYKVADAKRIADEAAEKAKKDAETAAVADTANYGAGAGGGLMPQNLHYAQGGDVDNSGYPGESVVRMAMGGISDAASHLGGYSDGGRLLRGPGDGVSDSIPAVIGRKQPARLADGEFVVPARIVSEIGNGSTEAGARKLYAMMDRVQKARGKTVGKGKVAKNTRADKLLPA
jgi:hypothetical protein